MNKEVVQQIVNHMDMNWEAIAKQWCSCTEKDINWDVGYSFHISPNVYCPLCKEEPPLDNDHYHCHLCAKLTQIG